MLWEYRCKMIVLYTGTDSFCKRSMNLFHLFCLFTQDRISFFHAEKFVYKFIVFHITA